MPTNRFLFWMGLMHNKKRERWTRAPVLDCKNGSSIIADNVPKMNGSGMLFAPSSHCLGSDSRSFFPYKHIGLVVYLPAAVFRVVFVLINLLGVSHSRPTLL